MAEHNVLTDPELHEPKGASTAALGEVYVSDGAGSGTWEPRQEVGARIGFADYNDLVTATTAITVPGTSTYVYITNDGLGAATQTAYLPSGVSATIWDSALNKFDWSSLALGDMVDVRLDFEITTTAANQVIEVAFEMATDGTAYDLGVQDATVKSAGLHHVDRYMGVYMGDTNTLNNKARFKIKSDAAATVHVLGWYVKVITNA